MLAVFSLAFGGYAMALQDARGNPDAVPGLPWLDEVHFAAGGLALAIGPLGFRRDLLARATEWHRKIGMTYVAAVFVSGLAACAMALYSFAGIATHLGFGALGLLWLGTTAVGLRRIHRGDVAGHRRAMVYSFALCFSAVTLRAELPLLALAFGSFETGYRIVSWSCWITNLAFAWWWLGRTDVAGGIVRREPERC